MPAYTGRHRCPPLPARRHARSNRAMTAVVWIIVIAFFILGLLFAIQQGMTAYMNGSS